MTDSMTVDGNMFNLTLSWGEPFNNFDPIVNYAVSCYGDVQCFSNFTTPDNSTRSYIVTNLNSAISYTFAVVASNSLGSGEPAIYTTRSGYWYALVITPHSITFSGMFTPYER